MEPRKAKLIGGPLDGQPVTITGPSMLGVYVWDQAAGGEIVGRWCGWAGAKFADLHLGEENAARNHDAQSQRLQ